MAELGQSNSDEIISRRTSTTGRSLLTISFGTFLSLWFGWDISKLWGLSEKAGIENRDLNIAVMLILGFLILNHFINWYADYTAHQYSKRLPLELEKQRLRHSMELDTKPSSLIEYMRIYQEHDDLMQKATNLQKLNSITLSYNLQIWMLNLLLPITVGVGAMFFLISVVSL